MGWGVANIGMLFGLAALAVPLLIHWLRRRRHDVVAWGAMQFLPANARIRQRRFWDELPLMALRMALIALLVLALAGPYSTSAIFAPVSERPARDVVIVLDGAYRMDRRDGQGRTPWVEAHRWAAQHIGQLGRGERAALIVARRPPLALQADLTADRGVLQTRLDSLGTPRGNSGLPAALAEAWRLLQAQSDAADQEVIVLTDRQYFGWADDATRRQWEAVGRQLHAEAETLHRSGQATPHLRIVDVVPSGAASLADFALSPLVVTRRLAAVGQSLKFTTALFRVGTPGAALPARLRVAVDGLHVQDVPVPDATATGTARVPLTFVQRFDTPGRHVVSVALDMGNASDALPADNEQHTVVEVVADLPVLLVDGDQQPGRESSTYFLDKALTGPGMQGAIAPRIVAYRELTPADILGTARQARPRVVVLADVPALPPSLQQAIATFLQDGGGVLVSLGSRVRAALDVYNVQLDRDSAAWLPARLVTVAGATDGNAVRPDAGSVQHPALALIRRGFGDVTVPRWWRLRADDKGAGTVVARLTNGDPLLIEKSVGKGRTLLLSVPLDRSWDSPLPGTWEFPVLVHELIRYLAGGHSDDWLLEDGQPLRVGPPAQNSAPGRLVIQTPEVASKTLQVSAWPWTDADSGAIGLYRVEREDGSREFFVVPPDLHQSEDRRCTNVEWTGVLNLLPMRATAQSGGDEPDRRHDLWWLCILGVMVLLCAEVFMTRRLALARRRSC